MHRIFRGIYQRQLRAFREVQTAGRLPEWERDDLIFSARRAMFVVDDALDAAVGAIGPDYTLRPDAKLLLAANLQQLVAMPLMLMAAEDAEMARKLETPYGIDGTVRADAVMIARAAKEIARERSNERELSAADILRGLSKVLEELRLKDYRLWDRDE